MSSIGPIDQATQSQGSGSGTIITGNVTTHFANSWAVLFTGGDINSGSLTPNSPWTSWNGSGSNFEQVLSSLSTIFGSCDYTPGPFYGDGWGMVLLTFPLTGGVGSPTIVQNGSGHSGATGSGSQNVSFSSPTTAGNTIIAYNTTYDATVFGGPGTWGLSDNQGNVYIHYSTTVSNQQLDVWVAENIAGGSPIITLNAQFGGAGWSFQALELSAVPGPNPTFITPVGGQQGQSLTVTVTGTAFDSGGTSTLSFSGTGIAVNSYGTRNSTTLVANIGIASGAALTARDVIVTNVSTFTGTLAGAFTVVGASTGGDTTTLTATVTVSTTPPPTPPTAPVGTVQFYDGVTPLDSPVSPVGGIAALVLPAVGGFGAFDKEAHTSGNNTPQAISVTPATSGEWAILANTSQGFYQLTPGFVEFSTFLGIMPLPTAAPVSVSNTVSNFGWLTNMVMFGGPSYPLACTISSIEVRSDVVTVTTSAQSFAHGTQVAFPAGLTASFLNNQILTIISNTGTQITLAFSHVDYGPVAESSPTLTNYPYLQSIVNASIPSPPISITFPNPVQAGSTILAATLYGDWNAHFNTSTVADGVNTYLIYDATGPGSGSGPLAFLNLYVALNATTGPITVTVNASSHNYATGAIFAAFEFPATTSFFTPGTHNLTARFTSSEPYFTSNVSNTVPLVVP